MSKTKKLIFVLFLVNFVQSQDLIHEDSLKNALRNVINFVEAQSNNFYAFKIDQVRIKNVKKRLVYSGGQLTLYSRLFMELNGRI